jgi:ferritin-like metal-binding protein YciE
MSLESIESFLLDEVKDLLSAEKQLVKALPKMAKAATNEELKAGFEQHLEETKQHVERLEKVFTSLGETAKAKHCQAMEGLIEEGSEIIKEDGEDMVKDAALITAAQKVEHYEISAYGSARAHAQLLGLEEVVNLLSETLEEEKATDEKLNQLAESSINIEAADKSEEEEETTKRSSSKKSSRNQTSMSR